jgi:hypothetical protein
MQNITEILRNIWQSRRWRLTTFIVAVVIIGLVIWTVARPKPPIQGNITYPISGATVHSKGYFNVGGTVENLPSGYRLLLFLQFTGDNKYFGGDPRVVVRDGKWSGSKLLYVGARHPIIVWLVAQGPKTITFMNTPLGETRWGDGFPSMQIASDSVILNSIELNVS